MLRGIKFFVGLAVVSAFVGCGESDAPQQDRRIKFTTTALPADGGTVKITVDGVESVDGKVTIGDVVQLTATSQSGYVFKEWTFTDSSLSLMDDIQNKKAKTIEIDTKNLGYDKIVELKANFEKMTVVKGGTWINGVVWANCNVDEPGKFTKRPEDPGMLYQWNKRIGFSTYDPMVCSDGSRIYENWEDQWWPMYDDRVDENGNDVITFEREKEPCPEGWRMPSNDEINSLREWPLGVSYDPSDPAGVTYEEVAATDSSMAGLKITCTKSGNSIFLPAVGARCGTSFWIDGYVKYELGEQNIGGYYRSNLNGYGFYFNQQGKGDGRSPLPLSDLGTSSVRCVADLK